MYIGRPTSRLPCVRWVPHQQCRGHNDYQKGSAQIGKGQQHTDALNEPRRDRSRNQRASPETADCNARDQTSSIRKPLDQHSYWNDIAEPQAYSADYTVTEVKPPQSAIRKAR